MEEKTTHTGKRYKWKESIDGDVSSISRVHIEGFNTNEEAVDLPDTPRDLSYANNPDGRGFSLHIRYETAITDSWSELKRIEIEYENGDSELVFEFVDE